MTNDRMPNLFACNVVSVVVNLFIYARKRRSSNYVTMVLGSAIDTCSLYKFLVFILCRNDVRTSFRYYCTVVCLYCSKYSVVLQLLYISTRCLFVLHESSLAYVVWCTTYIS